MKYVAKLKSTDEIVSVVHAQDVSTAEYAILKGIEADAKIRSNCQEVFVTKLQYIQHTDSDTAIFEASAAIDEECPDLRYIIVETSGGKA